MTVLTSSPFVYVFWKKLQEEEVNKGYQSQCEETNRMIYAMNTKGKERQKQLLEWDDAENMEVSNNN